MSYNRRRWRYVFSKKGYEVTLFDDFDIDFNQKKFFIEIRCSDTLISDNIVIRGWSAND